MLKDNSNVFIIAEISANHNNDFDTCVKTIESIAKSGADAVKVQTYKPESLTLDVNNEYFGPKKDGPWKGCTPYQVFSEGAMPYEWQPKLKEIANNWGLEFFSSPFDIEGVDFLESIGVNLYKVASFEITDIPLIEYIASKGKPMIISTGVAELCDIDMAVRACRKVGNNDITLLKCTSEYPAPVDKANLLTINNLRETFSVKVGVSDHTMGIIVPVVSVAIGATVVEKHFILNRKLGGPDSSFSMEPEEFTSMVKAVREAEKSLGKISYEISDNDKSRRRSLFLVEDIKAGEKITEKNIRSIRPAFGLHPKYYRQVLGKTVNRDIKKGTPLFWELFT
ncbi:MAG: pseudaminic acid synthase [Dysgonomonas sp.]